ncbi:MAG: type I restriction enzyme HsdR N-terminal domain-containing protein [Alphaproteobacteria bacterium]|nr:type I restriction enzyme HsdR N-terminal domain-containing protein [Alphaproteobacteria bacterium]
MDLEESLEQIANRISNKIYEEVCNNNEQQTIDVLIKPFLRDVLGYNHENPEELRSEFTADVSGRKGEKVDIVLMSDNKPIILIECKALNIDLSEYNRGQLERYFGVKKIDAKYAILTNGKVYKFFTDLDKSNNLDDKPFLEIDLSKKDFSSDVIEELKKFRKTDFDVEKIRSTAENLKFSLGIKRVIQEEFNSPSYEMLKFFQKKGVYNCNLTEGFIKRFSPLITTAYNNIIEEGVYKRLDSSKKADVKEKAEVLEEEEIKKKQGIVTTETELSIFEQTKSRLAYLVDTSELFDEIKHIVHHDYRGHFTVYYKREQRGLLFKFVEGENGVHSYSFKNGENITTDKFSDVDALLLESFKSSVDALK